MLAIRPMSLPFIGPSSAISCRAGETGSVRPSPKWTMSGPSTKNDRTAPAIIHEAIFGPIR